MRSVRRWQKWLWRWGCAGLLGSMGGALTGSSLTLAVVVPESPLAFERVTLPEKNFQETIAFLPDAQASHQGNWLHQMFNVEALQQVYERNPNKLQDSLQQMLGGGTWLIPEAWVAKERNDLYQPDLNLRDLNLWGESSSIWMDRGKTELFALPEGNLIEPGELDFALSLPLLPSLLGGEAIFQEKDPAETVPSLESFSALTRQKQALQNSVNSEAVLSNDATAPMLQAALTESDRDPVVRPVQPIVSFTDVLSQVPSSSPDIEPPSSAPQPEPAPPESFPEPVLPIPEMAPRPDRPGLRPDGLPATVQVERFEVVGSTVFSPEELAAMTAKFLQQGPLTFQDLLAAADAITQHYLEAGYITSGAFLPEQKIEAGVVKLQVLEGGLETIEVTGTRGLSPGYVRSRLAVATKTPLNRERLIEALQLLQRDPLIETLSTELSSSPEPGLSRLKVEVKEARSFYVEAFLDNGRSPSVGSFRRGVRIRSWNLSGWGDRAEATYSNTDGSNGLNLSYSRVLNPYNGTLSVAFGVTSSDVIEPPFEVLEIESDSRFYEVTLRQPLIQNPNQEFALGLTFSRQESETELLDIPFPLSAGADEDGRTRVSALRFFQDLTLRDEWQVFSLRSQFSLGLDAFGATLNDDRPDSRFFAWRGQVQWVRLLAPDTLFLLQGDIQLADGSLLSLEQFGLGGLDRLRGYRQDFLLTDNGIFASAELRIPVFRASDGSGTIQIAPFLDFGTGWNAGSADPDPSTLLSAGLGLRAQFSDRLTARFDWGIPIVSVDSSDRTWQENGLLFSMNYTLF